MPVFEPKSPVSETPDWGVTAAIWPEYP